ncbi:MAG: pyruvate, phosphate dikinase [Candidatus Neomarinimicrobiota bacterium]|nr:MAG: pyruvate, phosphate dikinase [Candidatus Neomarinimicrobiota bacterium]
MAKYVYFFGDGHADGTAEMKNALGGKGANLAEMTNLGIPVPPGFTITTEMCNAYYENNKQFPEELYRQVDDALRRVEAIMDKRFGDPDNPLLVSVRSGARQSMPGMMDTVLNVGLTSATIPGLIRKSQNPTFVYDAYRRLIMMYADVVMEKAEGIEPEEGQDIRKQLEQILEAFKAEHGYASDTDLGAEEWKTLAEQFKVRIQDVLGVPFPDDPRDQLWGAIRAVFQSWNGKRAVHYRRIEGIPDDWGTAVNVQTMVFGNMGDTSATGVAFTRNPATGENVFYGEWLQNAQGEDVVAGIRTPHPLNETTRTGDTQDSVSLETFLPEVYRQLVEIRNKLESHYRDMQDIEFTIEDGRLWMLQTRTGKRTGPAAIRMAVDMVREGLIDEQTALLRVQPKQLDELLHPMLNPLEEKKNPVLATGLPAGPGGATGQIVFTADDAERWARDGKRVVLVREETSPEDVHGMHAAAAILTAKGGMTSHAALVARGWGKCCIVGCGALQINVESRTLTVKDQTFHEGDWLSLNGSRGILYAGQIPLIDADPETNTEYAQLMQWADGVRSLQVRTNADRPGDASQARKFGAQGIGLCRTEHMFFDPQRILAMRKMILADSREERRRAVMELLPFQRQDFKGILDAMEGLPVTIRLLDPPLHEFINLTPEQVEELAGELKLQPEVIQARIDNLHEFNPMLGHRGCRLGIAYPEITEMQARAIFEATAELTGEGKQVFPEVMIPLVGTATEFEHQEKIVRDMAAAVMEETGTTFEYLVGTMIELPRAALTADEIARRAEFFSFGTNDLTQTTYGFSRDDIGSFLPEYLQQKILTHDPFQSLDTTGVGQLVRMGVEKGRSVRPGLKVGICGEHGGDPASIQFCHSVGLNYVSCSPYRVPIARLAAAQAALTASD